MTLRLSASPEELRKQFYSMRTAQDVADLLEINVGTLHYHIYIIPKSSRYTTFDIPKRAGGTRTISAPVTALKIIQQKLNQVLQYVYPIKPSVHSFIHDRSILTNALVHCGRKNVLNIDLKDFFPFINFGRVRGLFMGTPYKLGANVATVLAQICCFDNQLPQGAPTSPIVSNMVCAKMDSQLIRLAQENRCDYTRYADDISFSTNMRELPPALATMNDLGQIEVGSELAHIISQNGFQVNPDKVRLRGKNRRQEVTGLVTNKFPNVRRKYVRQIRAMLHAWKKFGLEAAENEFWNRYSKKHRNPQKHAPSFERVVKGKIDFLGMVRGKENFIYLHLTDQLRELAPNLVKEPVRVLQGANATGLKPLVIAEGKTDYMHLEAALSRLKESGLYKDLQVDFFGAKDDMGKDQLLRMCEMYSKTNQIKPHIFVFDREDRQTVKKVSDRTRAYHDWGNNVFSFAIPALKHRDNKALISIELYYKDSEITRLDKNARRLFLSTEFDNKSGRHKSLNLNCTLIKKFRAGHVSIIDCDVYNDKNENVALSKADFASYVLNGEMNFDDFDFSEFRGVFDIFAMIMKKARQPTT